MTKNELETLYWKIICINELIASVGDTGEPIRGTYKRHKKK